MGSLQGLGARLRLGRRGAGARLRGRDLKTTPEFGNLGETYTKIAPTCNNPWDLTRIPGGSSGGAAASVARD